MKIAAVLCARNEAHIIEEWVAHHLALGIARIQVFDHMSTDGTREILERIHEVVPGVTVETWNPPDRVHVGAFNRGLQMMTDEDMDWCAFLDADEFIGNAEAESSEGLADLLERHAQHCAIALNWVIFGSSGHVSQPAMLVQEAFLRRAPDQFVPHHLVKSLVRPKYTMGALHAHGFSLNYPYYTAGGDLVVWSQTDPGGIPVGDIKYTANPAEISGWRVNHYFCQWRRRWDAKVERAKVRGAEATQRTELHWNHHDRNEVFDPAALRWIDKDRSVMAQIMGATSSSITFCS